MSESDIFIPCSLEMSWFGLQQVDLLKLVARSILPLNVSIRCCDVTQNAQYCHPLSVISLCRQAGLSALLSNTGVSKRDGQAWNCSHSQWKPQGHIPTRNYVSYHNSLSLLLVELQMTNGICWESQYTPPNDMMCNRQRHPSVINTWSKHLDCNDRCWTQVWWAWTWSMARSSLCPCCLSRPWTYIQITSKVHYNDLKALIDGKCSSPGGQKIPCSETLVDRICS